MLDYIIIFQSERDKSKNLHWKGRDETSVAGGKRKKRKPNRKGKMRRTNKDGRANSASRVGSDKSGGQKTGKSSNGGKKIERGSNEGRKTGKGSNNRGKKTSNFVFIGFFIVAGFFGL